MSAFVEHAWNHLHPILRKEASVIERARKCKEMHVKEAAQPTYIKGSHIKRDVCLEPPNYRISTIMAQYIKSRSSYSVWNVPMHKIKLSQEPNEYLCDMQSSSGVISSFTDDVWSIQRKYWPKLTPKSSWF